MPVSSLLLLLLLVLVCVPDPELDPDAPFSVARLPSLLAPPPRSRPVMSAAGSINGEIGLGTGGAPRAFISPASKPLARCTPPIARIVPAPPLGTCKRDGGAYIPPIPIPMPAIPVGRGESAGRTGMGAPICIRVVGTAIVALSGSIMR